MESDTSAIVPNNKSRFTPGPWRAVYWSCNAATTIKAGDVVVAECTGHGRPVKESLADARLIEHAPDMAAMLLGAFLHVSHGGPTRGELEDLLRKAGVL